MTLDDFKARYRLAPDRPGDGEVIRDDEPGPDTCPCCEPAAHRGRRPPLTPGAPAITSVCAWCLEAGEVEAPAGPISHGICTRHADAMRQGYRSMAGATLAAAPCRCGHARGRHLHAGGPGGRLCFPRDVDCECRGFERAL